MTTLAQLPVELLLDNVLPSLPTPSLLALAQTSRLFAQLADDDTLWRRRLAADFNFSGQTTARTSGWKIIYRGLSKPRTFVWGDRAKGRLGVAKTPKSSLGGNGVPWPLEIRIPGKRIVSLVPGGMCVYFSVSQSISDPHHLGRSFHALDSEGEVYVWGAPRHP
jgi:SCF-associated factor 1